MGTVTSLKYSDDLYYTLNDNLEDRLIKILLNDPSSEVKRIAESYLIQCIYDATEDPDKNPILHNFFYNPIRELKQELEDLKAEVHALNSEVHSKEEDKDRLLQRLEVQTEMFNYKIENIERKLRENGIDIYC